MKKTVKLFGIAFLGWLIPFTIGFAAFPLRKNNDPLFETIMPISLVCVAVLFSFIWFKKIDKNFFKEGFKLGITLMTVSLFIDLLLFMPESPMHMSFINYVKDIGLTYIIFPVITAGAGFILDKHIG